MGLITAKSKFLAFTAEAVKGTYLAPATYILARDPKISRDISMIALPFASAMGRVGAVVGEQKGGATFSLDMAGGTALAPIPSWAGLLPSCGFSATGNTYNLIGQSSYGTVSIAKVVGTVQDTIYGAAGSVTFTLPTNGKANAEFNYSGIYKEQAGVAAPNPTITYKHGPVFRNAIVSWGLWSPKVSSVKIEIANTIELAVASVGTLGYLYAAPTERTVTITIDPYTEAVADKAVVADLLNGTAAQFSVTCGTDDGNKFTITAPNAQAENVADGEREGFASYDLKLVCNGRTDGTNNGNGELSIAFA